MRNKYFTDLVNFISRALLSLKLHLFSSLLFPFQNKKFNSKCNLISQRFLTFFDEESVVLNVKPFLNSSLNSQTERYALSVFKAVFSTI